MSLQVERLEHNMAKLTIEVDAKEFDAAMKKAYNKSKSRFDMPGFRKGKVPMNVIEKTYGAGVFYEDAANTLMQETYPAAVEESGLDIVSSPEVDVTQIGKGQNFIYTATVAVKPEVTLGEYKGLTVEKDSVEVSDEEVDAEIKKELEKNARKVEVTDRAVKEGDIIKLNYAGEIDGVPFDGGTASNQELTIGSHSFIDTFEDQLVGLNIGDKKDVEVTFPAEYHAEDLAGKPAVFHVEILGITENQVDELTEDFVQDTTEFDSVDEYKAAVREKLVAGKEEVAKRNMEESIMEQIIANATMDIPAAMVDGELDQMVKDYEQRLQYQGLALEQYLQYTGSNLDAFKESLKEQAEKRIQSSLVLEAIVAAENIEAEDADVDAEIEKMAQMYQMDVEQVRGFVGEAERENMKRDLAVQKAFDFLLENANVTEASDELEFVAE